MQLIQAEQLFYNLSNRFTQLAQTNVSAFLLAMATVATCGVIFSFFGYRIHRWSLACVGAAAGIILAMALLDFISIKPDNPHYLRISLAVIFAAIGGFIAPKLFTFSSFLLGGGAFALALHPLVPLFDEPYGWLALLLGFIAGGSLVLVIKRPILILATAIAGSYLTGTALFSIAIFYQILPRDFNFYLFYGFWGNWSLVSMIVQFQTKAASNQQSPIQKS
jgi:hypothetical protein